MAHSIEDIERLFDLIEDKLVNGFSLRQSLKDEHISSKTFYEWIEDEDKRKRYARACTERAEKIFEEILDIADDSTNDYMTIKKGDEEYQVVNPESAQRSRLRIDSRKWMLGKMQPEKYGEKIIHSGDKDNPIEISFVD